MKRSITVVMIFCLLFFAGCNGNPIKLASAASRYQSGCEAYAAGEYKKAVKDFKGAVKKDTTGELSVYCYSYLGHCMMEQGDTETALKYYETALCTGAEPALCYTNLGVYYRKMKEYLSAEQYYRKALEANDAYTDALTSLGVLYVLTGQNEEAISVLERAVTVQGEYSAVYDANLAYAYAAVGRTEDAKKRLAVAKAKGYEKDSYDMIFAYIVQCEEDLTESPMAEDNSGKEESDRTETSESSKEQESGLTNVPETTSTPVPTEKPVTENGKLIVLDPGHQSAPNYEKEPVGPGASELKTKVAAGTRGVTTKVPEHQLNLELSLKLRKALENAGYEVLLTRETAEVDISNAERAEIANEADADIYIRVHADGADNPSANGISVLYPSETNPYVAWLSPESKKLAQAVLDGMCQETGAKNRGIVKRDDLTGTNWAQMPVIVVEAGFMTNEAEEKKLLDGAYQSLLVKGMVAGIEEYFEE